MMKDLVLCGKSLLIGGMIGAAVITPGAVMTAFYLSQNKSLSQKLGCEPGIPVRVEGVEGAAIITCDEKRPGND